MVHWSPKLTKGRQHFCLQPGTRWWLPAQRCWQHNLDLCVFGPQELRRLLLRLTGPSTPWLRGGHLKQEFGDVLQCHTAGHRLKRRWYGDVDERGLLNRGGLVAVVKLDLLRIQTALSGPAEVVRSREPVGTGGGARPARLWIDDPPWGSQVAG